MSDLICVVKCRNGLENCIGDALVILADPARAGLELACLRLSQLEQFPYAAVSPDVIVEEVILENPLEIDVVGDPLVLQAILRVARDPTSSKPRGALGSSQCAGRAPNVSSKLGPRSPQRCSSVFRRIQPGASLNSYPIIGNRHGKLAKTRLHSYQSPFGPDPASPLVLRLPAVLDPSEWTKLPFPRSSSNGYSAEHVPVCYSLSDTLPAFHPDAPQFQFRSRL